MRKSRRDLLAAGATALSVGIAGCSSTGDESAGDGEGTTSSEETSAETTSETSAGTTSGESESSEKSPAAGVDAAVAAEWNAMRARVSDAVALGEAGDAGTGAAVAKSVFERFEQASGEYGAHEALERTSESSYAEFEEALGELRTAGLEAEDLARAREEAGIARAQLGTAQEKLVGKTTANVLDLQLFGADLLNAGALASAGKFEAARSVAEDVLGRFEEASVHDALESASSESYEAFEGAVEAAVEAAKAEDAEKATTKAGEAYQAAIDGSYALADAEAAAGAGHVATLQARGWDAAALAQMGGPSTSFAHAVGLTIYRARVHDARLLAARGESGRAATMAGDVFAHFEGAKAHEALEEADGEAYEGFESGLSKLQSALEGGNATAADEALATVDENLVAGIQALAGSNAALLESAFFRARLADARELYRLGHDDAAEAAAQGLFERFEADELGFHETVEHTSEDVYHDFEEEHLSGLIDAFGNGDDDAVATHYQGAHDALGTFEGMAGSRATVSGVQAAYMAASGFDAAVLDSLGEDSRAESIARGAFERFEAGAGGYHEALEEADHETYEAFEKKLGAVATAAKEGQDVYPAAKKFAGESLSSAYAIVGAAGGSQTEVAKSVLQGAFAHFEEARVHEMLEAADRSAYHSFEGQLKAYQSALEEGKDVASAADSFAKGAQYAQFALVDAVEQLPLELEIASGGGGSEEGHGGHGGGSEMKGGPNVVEGVPEDADHVVKMQAVAFDPKELTVSKGDTVAFEHAAGEAHSVTAYEGKIPDGAGYWASGGFDSQSAAKNGWENGEGAVKSGHSYVHTFETKGTHEYFCIPHEAAGMTGTIVVE